MKDTQYKLLNTGAFLFAGIVFLVMIFQYFVGPKYKVSSAEMPEKAREIFDWLKMDYMIQYDDKDAIGRRYRRQDAIGTPYCITIDSETLENDTVTIRERDSMKQDRIPINKISTIINERLTLKS